jgi:hypothetical protein
MKLEEELGFIREVPGISFAIFVCFVGKLKTQK